MTIIGGHKAAVAILMLAAATLSTRGGESWAQSEVPAFGAPNENSCNRAQFRILLDVGHTAQEPGAKSARGLLEYDYNLRLAKEIDQALLDARFTQSEVLVTGGHQKDGLAKRVAHANQTPPDIFLSIHHDSVPDSFLEKWEFEGERYSFSDRFKGHSIFVSWENPARQLSLRFARLLGLGLKAHGLKYTPHYTQSFMGRWQHQLVDSEAGVYRYDKLRVLRKTGMPAVLLEAGSIINRDQELELKAPERRALISAAVVEAAASYCATLPSKLARQAKH